MAPNEVKYHLSRRPELERRAMTVTVPDTLWRDFKALCAQQRVSLSATVVDLIDQHLKQSSRKK